MEIIKKNKILILAQSYRSFVKDQVEAIAKHYEQVSVLVCYNPLVELSSLLRVKRYYRYRKRSLIDNTAQPANVEVFIVPVIFFPFNYSYKTLGQNHYHAALRVIKKNNIDFDLIHAHFTWSAGYVGARLKEKYGKPLVITAHGFDIYDLPFRDEEWKDKIEYVLNTSDFIITVSNSNLEYINKLNVKKPVKVIPNGFSTELFYPQDKIGSRKKLCLPLDKKILLSVGNLVEIKGHKYLIDAMAQIRKIREDVICIIIGNGNLESKLKKQIKALALQEKVILIDRQPHCEINLWMNAADLFVLPSLRESFGVVQIEAMACGKPVVATYNGGSEEIIINDKLGLLCKPANSTDLANNIIRALSMKWEADGIIHYAQQMDWNNITNNIININEAILSESNHFIPLTTR